MLATARRGHRRDAAVSVQFGFNLKRHLFYVSGAGQPVDRRGRAGPKRLQAAAPVRSSSAGRRVGPVGTRNRTGVHVHEQRRSRSHRQGRRTSSRLRGGDAGVPRTGIRRCWGRRVRVERAVLRGVCERLNGSHRRVQLPLDRHHRRPGPRRPRTRRRPSLVKRTAERTSGPPSVTWAPAMLVSA